MRILLVDPDATSSRIVKDILAQQGYSVDRAASSSAGDEAAVVDHHDLVILFDRRPELDGVHLCRAVRRQGVSTPILILFDPASTAATVAGLDVGADDCLASPFEMAELLARVRSLLRRSQASEGSLLASGNLLMNLLEHRVALGGVRVKLSAKEFALLEFMMRNPRRLLTRTMISESVWDMNYDASSNVIDVYVSNLRRKVDLDATRRRIETVIGCGYRFVDPDEIAEVSELAPRPSDSGAGSGRARAQLDQGPGLAAPSAS